MFELYAIPVSLYCAKVRIVLRHKGLDWVETPPPGGYGSAEYRALVPAGNLPALRHDGALIADSEAIAEYLEEIRPDPAMLPQAPTDRAAARARGRLHDTRLEPALRRLFAHLPGRPACPPELAAAQSVEISARLADFARLPAPEPTLSLGDCGYPITFAWIDALTPLMGLAIDWPAAVTAERARLAAEPAVAAELEAYLPRLNAFLAA